MNWSYISGFFDADGSITLSNQGNSKFKTVNLTFHNNELEILESIQDFIFNEIGVKGFIVRKKSKKDSHRDSFDLKYDYFFKVNRLLKNMEIIHPKKLWRKQICINMESVIPRNGKYSKTEMKKRMELEKLFFEFKKKEAEASFHKDIN